MGSGCGERDSTWEGVPCNGEPGHMFVAVVSDMGSGREKEAAQHNATSTQGAVGLQRPADSVSRCCQSRAFVVQGRGDSDSPEHSAVFLMASRAHIPHLEVIQSMLSSGLGRRQRHTFNSILLLPENLTFSFPETLKALKNKKIRLG